MITNTKLFLNLLIAQLMLFQIDWSGVYVFYGFQNETQRGARCSFSAVRPALCEKLRRMLWMLEGWRGWQTPSTGPRRIYIYARPARARENTRLHTSALLQEMRGVLNYMHSRNLRGIHLA